MKGLLQTLSVLVLVMITLGCSTNPSLKPSPNRNLEAIEEAIRENEKTPYSYAELCKPLTPVREDKAEEYLAWRGEFVSQYLRCYTIHNSLVEHLQRNNRIEEAP